MERVFYVIIFIVLFTISGCQNQKQKHIQNADKETDLQSGRELELILKEIELRERELDLRERELELSIGSEKKSLTSIYNEVKRGVYLIYTSNNIEVSQGSAFVINSNGLAVSNFHVFENASSAIAINDFGEEFMITEVLEVNEEKDYIIFRLGNQDDFPFLKIANNLPEVGEDVFAVGNPRGLNQTLSTGIISGFRSNKELLQTTTSITYGSSGGPLFNKQGEVIGVTTSGLDEANLNFAINIHELPLKRFKEDYRINNLASELSQDELKTLIKSYYKALREDDWAALYSLYAYDINRFYDKFNIDKYEAISLAKSYKPTFKIIDVNNKIRWNTFKVNFSQLGAEITFTMDYSIVREEKNKPSEFVLEIVLVVDKDKKISSIYENILSKR